MGLRETIYNTINTITRQSNPEAQPFDVKKYHRAFIAGLYGLSATLTPSFIFITQNAYIEAIATILVGFMIPFSTQLLAEYGLKPSQSPG